MTISVRLNKEESLLFKNYAKLNGITISELIRKAVIERIEDEYDLMLYNEAMEEFKNNPITYSLEEVERELCL